MTILDNISILLGVMENCQMRDRVSYETIDALSDTGSEGGYENI